MTRYEKKCPHCNALNWWRPYNLVHKTTRELVPISDSGECEILDKDGFPEEMRTECHHCGKTFQFKKVKITL